jgi:hypothetical protein
VRRPRGFGAGSAERGGGKEQRLRVNAPGDRDGRWREPGIGQSGADPIDDFARYRDNLDRDRAGLVLAFTDSAMLEINALRREWKMPSDLKAEDAVELPFGADRETDDLGERAFGRDLDNGRSPLQVGRCQAQQRDGIARLRIDLADRSLALAQQPIALAGLDRDAAPGARREPLP